MLRVAGQALCLSALSVLLVAASPGCGSDDPEEDPPRFEDAGTDTTDPGDTGPPDTNRPDTNQPDADSGGGDAADSGDVVYDCTSPNACQGARDVGSLSGDTDPPNNSLNTEGFTSEWLRVRMTEDDSNITGATMRLTVTLVSPSGSNFDLLAYVNEDVDQVECDTIFAQSVKPAGQTDVVNLAWGEGIIPNTNDDSRTVTINVRSVMGECTPDKKWTMILQGNV